MRIQRLAVITQKGEVCYALLASREPGIGWKVSIAAFAD
jgi:hypothetical protein